MTERSEVFVDDWRAASSRAEPQQIWLGQAGAFDDAAPAREAGCGLSRVVLVYPAGSPSFARATAEHRSVLNADDTFDARTIESPRAAPDAPSAGPVAALRERYILSAS